MTSEELAAEVKDAIERTTSRVVGEGHDQYSFGDKQLFESLPPEELLAWALEELDDLIVYAVMTGIQIKRIREAM